MNAETRNCTACRYKACIAAGMDMKNSNEKFGCHTADFKSKGPNIKTNLAFKIRDSFRTFQNSITQNRQTLFEWNRAYVKFKEECMDYGVFLNGDMPTDIDKNEYSFREAFLLKIMSLLYAALFINFCKMDMKIKIFQIISIKVFYNLENSFFLSSWLF